MVEGDAGISFLDDSPQEIALFVGALAVRQFVRTAIEIPFCIVLHPMMIDFLLIEDIEEIYFFAQFQALHVGGNAEEAPRELRRI